MEAATVPSNTPSMGQSQGSKPSKVQYCFHAAWITKNRASSCPCRDQHLEVSFKGGTRACQDPLDLFCHTFPPGGKKGFASFWRRRPLCGKHGLGLAFAFLHLRAPAALLERALASFTDLRLWP